MMDIALEAGHLSNAECGQNPGGIHQFFAAEPGFRLIYSGRKALGSTTNEVRGLAIALYPTVAAEINPKNHAI